MHMSLELDDGLRSDICDEEHSSVSSKLLPGLRTITLGESLRYVTPKAKVQLEQQHKVALRYYCFCKLSVVVAGLLVLATSVAVAIEERWSFVDGVYFFAVTITTVGFGDLVPRKPSSKLLSCILVAASLCLIAAMLAQMQDAILRRYRTNKILRVTPFMRFSASVLSLLVVVTCSVAFLHAFEQLPLIDSIYFTVMTICTVGYGDIVPLRRPGVIFTIALVLVGPLLLGRVITAFVEMHAESIELLDDALLERAFKEGGYAPDAAGLAPAPAPNTRNCRRDGPDDTMPAAFALRFLIEQGAISEENSAAATAAWQARNNTELHNRG
jgi:hypothetical protein